MDITHNRFITNKEEVKLFKTITPFVENKNRSAIVDLFLFQLLSLTGLRISEALKLTWSQHISDDYILVKAIDSKSGKARSIRIGRKLQGLIEEFKRDNPYSWSDYVFNTQKGPYKRTNAHEKLKYWLKVAGLRINISRHSFRHSYATKGLDAGLGLAFVKSQLGHSSIAVTSVYLHYTKEVSDKAYEVF